VSGVPPLGWRAVELRFCHCVPRFWGAFGSPGSGAAAGWRPWKGYWGTQPQKGVGRWLITGQGCPSMCPGCTRATMEGRGGCSHPRGCKEPRKPLRGWERRMAWSGVQRVLSLGHPARGPPFLDQTPFVNLEFLVGTGQHPLPNAVPALCTHRPSLLPIGLGPEMPLFRE